MSFKPKILVIGHTWVKYIQEEYMQNPDEDLDLSFGFEEGIRIDGLIEMASALLTPEHTHVFLFSLLPDILIVQGAAGKPGKIPRYPVLLPNSGFDPGYFAERMNAFTERCKMINPHVKVVLMLPPVIDLVHHNKIRVESYPKHILKAYMENPKYDDRLLFTRTKEVSNTMILLRGNNFSWLEKQIFCLQTVIQNVLPDRNRFSQFMKGEIFTLGNSSHLFDGFHPTPLFIIKMWNRLKSSILFGPQNSNSMQNNMTSRPPKAKKMKFDSVPLLKTPNFPMMNFNSSAQNEPIRMSKMEFDSFPRESNQSFPRESNQSGYKTSPFEDKTLPLPPPPPQLSGLRLSMPQRDNNGQTRYANSSPNHSDSEVESSSNITPPTKPRSLQLVDVNYISQEIDKFASFMAGHAHAVGQNMSIRDIKQMMINVLKES